MTALESAGFLTESDADGRYQIVESDGSIIVLGDVEADNFLANEGVHVGFAFGGAADSPGEIRYDLAEHKLLVSDGTMWIPLAFEPFP